MFGTQCISASASRSSFVCATDRQTDGRTDVIECLARRKKRAEAVGGHYACGKGEWAGRCSRGGREATARVGRAAPGRRDARGGDVSWRETTTTTAMKPVDRTSIVIRRRVSVARCRLLVLDRSDKTDSIRFSDLSRQEKFVSKFACRCAFIVLFHLGRSGLTVLQFCCDFSLFYFSCSWYISGFTV